MAVTYHQQWLQVLPEQLGHCQVSCHWFSVGAVNVHRPVTGKDEPRSDGTVHALEMVFKEGVLRRTGVKGMFSAHEEKVDAAVVKSIPAHVGRR